MSLVPTLTGPVPGADLGVTLLHEHLFVGHPELDLNLPHPEWDEERVMDEATRGLGGLAALGVRTLVDLTVPGLGRDIDRVRALACQSEVRIVAATGYYTADVLPAYFHTHGPGGIVGGEDPLEHLFRTDLTVGIAGSSIRAAVIKVVSDSPGFTPDVTRVWRAAAVAHAETGAPIMTHSHAPSRGGLEQQRVLAGLGVPLDRVVIGHAGDSDDLGYLRELAAGGSFLGFDRFGMEHIAPDQQRVRTLLTLLEEGLAEQIVLSHDAAFFSRITPPSWRRRVVPNWRMDFLFDGVLPQLRAAGVDEATITTMLVDTPRRILAGESV
ncbi:MAG: phosphotriesterase-related protein [bacterium]|nr:phosphotriesterase-related protein [bacterium]